MELPAPYSTFLADAPHEIDDIIQMISDGDDNKHDVESLREIAHNLEKTASWLEVKHNGQARSLYALRKLISVVLK